MLSGPLSLGNRHIVLVFQTRSRPNKFRHLTKVTHKWVTSLEFVWDTAGSCPEADVHMCTGNTSLPGLVTWLQWPHLPAGPCPDCHIDGNTQETYLVNTHQRGSLTQKPLRPTPPQ